MLGCKASILSVVYRLMYVYTVINLLKEILTFFCKMKRSVVLPKQFNEELYNYTEQKQNGKYLYFLLEK